MKIKVKALPAGFKEYSNIYGEDNWANPSGAYLTRRIMLRHGKHFGMKGEDCVIYLRNGRWRVGVRKGAVKWIV